jgi:hypothetical protein
MTGVRQIDADTLTQSGLVDPAINDSSLCPLDPTSRVIALGIRGHHPRSLDPSIPRSLDSFNTNVRSVPLDRIDDRGTTDRYRHRVSGLVDRVIALGIRGHHPRSLDPWIPGSLDPWIPGSLDPSILSDHSIRSNRSDRIDDVGATDRYRHRVC